MKSCVQTRSFALRTIFCGHSYENLMSAVSQIFSALFIASVFQVEEGSRKRDDIISHLPLDLEVSMTLLAIPPLLAPQ